MSKGQQPGGKPVEAKPPMGGRLMSGLSADSAGIQNYTRKEEFRRFQDREIRAEGYEWFAPNPLQNRPAQGQPPGSTTPVSVICTCKMGNGMIGIVAGNPTELWAYIGLETQLYYDVESGSTYYDVESNSTYYNEVWAGWQLIGSGFTSPARRWEFVQVSDWLVLNNGVDLPVTWQVFDQQVYPIYELREQQIACVGTIAMQDGCLCCMDITQINDDAFQSIMQPIAGAVNVSQNTSGVLSATASTLFPSITPSTLVGLTLFWAPNAWGNGYIRTIVNVDGSGNIYVGESQPVADSSGNAPYSTGWTPTFAAQPIASGPVTLENAAAYATVPNPSSPIAPTTAASVQRYAWRFFPSMANQPRRFGATVPVTFQAGSPWGQLLYPVRSIPELISKQIETSFITTGIGLASANLTADVVWCWQGITNVVLLNQKAQTTQVAFWPSNNSYTNATPLQPLMEAADASESFAGVFEDIEDDGGAIVKAITLLSQLVIFKDTPVIFLATYQGATAQPFTFQKVPINQKAARLRYRNTLIAGGGGFYGSHVIYAGEHAFYKFDLFMQTPAEIPQLQPCQDLFFFNNSDFENSFAAENPLSRELYFVFPNQSGINNYALCLDYAYNTVRTTTVPLCAAGAVYNPTTGAYLFAMGLTDGTIKRYGLFDAPLFSSGTVTATLSSGGVVTASGSIFQPSHVGCTIVFNNPVRDANGFSPLNPSWTPTYAPGVMAAISAYNSPTSVNVFAAAGVTLTSGQTFTINPAIWHRDGAAYSSSLQTGADGMGFEHGHKTLNEYLLYLSSFSANSPLTVTFRGGTNPATVGDVQKGTIKCPNYHNLLKPTLIQFYLGARVDVNGLNNPLEIVGQLFNVQPITSHSFGKGARQ